MNSKSGQGKFDGGKSSVSHFVGGLTGGLASTLILHSVDLAKVRIQTSRFNVSSFSILKSIYQKRGLRGIYQGFTPNALANCLAWGVYLGAFNQLNMVYKERNNLEKSSYTPAYVNYINSTISSLFTILFSNPIWLVKVRMCEAESNSPYTSISKSLKLIYKEEGFKGLYKGFVPGLFGTIHGCIFMVLYQELRKQAQLYKTKENNLDLASDIDLNSLEVLGITTIAKVMALVLTYPYQTIRTRLQSTTHSYNGLVDLFKTTFKNESYAGFYRGMFVSIFRITPATCITFVTYEGVIKIAKKY